MYWNLELVFINEYGPGACMTAYEQLFTFTVCCPFQVYMPSKPGKYRIKIWGLLYLNSY